MHPVGSVGSPKESKSSSEVYIFKSPTDVYLSITFGMLHYFPIFFYFMPVSLVYLRSISLVCSNIVLII